MIKKNYCFFENDYIDFWCLLNVNLYDTTENIDNAYLESSLKNLNHIDEFYVGWKLLRDKKFENLYIKCKSLKEVYDAGFFLDYLSLDDIVDFNDVNYLTTPLNKVKLNFKKSKKNIVLVTTGGFSPIHEGHVFNMEIAKKELEKHNYNVLAGYFSPSHDDYVSQKDNGKANNIALNRIKICNEKIIDSDWLMTSPFESVYVKTSINYTDVVLHLKKYFKKHITDNIIVGYVFGGDNATFIKAFENSDDVAICISRNHANESFIDNYDFSNINYFYIKENPYFEISSTKIRKTKPINIIEKNKKNNFLIRDDYKMFGFPDSLSPIKDVKKIFEDSIENFDVHVVDVSDQIEKGILKKIKTSYKTISLDVYLKGDFNVSISRVFNHSDSQLKANRMCQRPESISCDIDKIEKDIDSKYTLIEDDIVSGYTLKYFKSMINKVFEIEDFIILSDLVNFNFKFDDVVDLRDFIINSKYSGLVVEINNYLIRVPYILPYVDVTNRASIKPSEALIFSKKILELNLLFYKNIKKLGINIELEYSIEFLCSFIGIKKEYSNVDTVINFCKWHLEKIERIL